MRVLYIYGTRRKRRMYLHDPGLTQFADWSVTTVNGTMQPQRLLDLNNREKFPLTILHGYQAFKAVKRVARRKLGLLVFVPSNDVPWFNGRNTQAVLSLKPNVVMTEQRVRIDWYQKHAKKAVWFPPACATDVFKPLDVKLTHDVAFAGTMARASKYGKRNKWVRTLPNHGFKTLIRSGVTQQVFNEIYNRGRLAFHMSQFMSEGKRSQGIAYRVFEVGGIGRPLLLDPTPAIRLLFKEDIHFIGYSGWWELVDKIGYYLNHPGEADAIGKEMRDLILSRHTYQHRGRRLRELVEGML